jgi:hypothetical protein
MSVSDACPFSRWARRVRRLLCGGPRPDPVSGSASRGEGAGPAPAPADARLQLESAARAQCQTAYVGDGVGFRAVLPPGPAAAP